MQVTGDMDWKEQVAVGAKALDQREEFGAVRNLTSKLATDRISGDATADFCPGVCEGYAGMDSALPFHWESLTGKGGGRGQHKVSKSTDSSQEFEFRMSGVSCGDTLGDSVVPDGISPADDLFYKGQLLPLHLPKRLQMVKKLSSPKHHHHDTMGSASPGVACFFEPDSLKCASLGGESSYLSSALVNSRSSSFHSQGSHNFWESDSPGERDSGDSSSSRDSSGSSQDSSSVPEKRALPKFDAHTAFEKEGAFLHNRDFLDSQSLRSERSPQPSSWLRTSFKWKVFFGLKKPLKPSSFATASLGAVKSDELRKDGKESSGKCPRPAVAGAAAGGGGGGANGRPSSRLGVHSNGELQKAETPVVQGGGGGEGLSRREERSGGDWDAELESGPFSFPLADSSNGFSGRVVAGEQVGSSSKGRDGLHKYLNILKPASAKSATSTSTSSRPAQTGVNTSFKIMAAKAKTSFSGNLTSSGCKQQPLSSFSSGPAAKAFTSPRTSLQEPWTSSSSRCRSPTIIHSSLSGNLRIPSFSRSSKVSSNAAAAGKIAGAGAGGATSASPNHSGLLSCSHSSMAELHSSIQGAIAHCKQSQSSVGK